MGFSSPTKFGLEEDGSPTNIALVSLFNLEIKICAAEKVLRPVIKKF